MSAPTIVVEIAFSTTEILTVPSSWTDVSSYVLEDGLSIRRGRSDEMQSLQASTAMVMLNNLDRRFSPDNTGGAYYPNVKPKRRMRIRATWDSVTYTLWTGFITKYTPTIVRNMPTVTIEAIDIFGAYLSKVQFPQSLLRDDVWSASASETITYSPVLRTGDRTITTTAYDDAAVNHPVKTVTFTGTDESGIAQVEVLNIDVNAINISSNPVVTTTATRWKTLSQIDIQQQGTSGTAQLRIELDPTFPSTSTAFAIGAILDVADVDTLERDITGLGTTSVDAYTVDGASVNSLLQTITDTEAGYLYIAKDGKITFRREDTRETISTVATFGTTTYPYKSIKFSYGDRYIYNVVNVTRTGGKLNQQVDTTSGDEYGYSTLNKSNLPFLTDNDANTYAGILLARYKQPGLRIEEIELSGYLNPTSLWPVILSLELNDKIDVYWYDGAGHAWILGTGALDSTTILGYGASFFIEQINYTINRGVWSVTLRVSPEFI